VVAAKQSVAALFQAWGDTARAQRLRVEAAEMRERMLRAYWVDEDGTLAFALDGRKRVIRTATSNPGHCLWTGVVDAERGQRVADRLMRPDLWSGFGVRTLSSEHPAFDPFSYQRGSVWPHDSMLAAAGMRRYGRIGDFWAIVDGLLDAVTSFERCQMPELFAGLQRHEEDVPLPYDQANVPQAWAAGTMFHAVRLLLGFEPDVPAGRVYVDPALPPWCPELTLDNVRVGGERLSIHARRHADGRSTAEVTARSGHLEVVQGAPPWLVAGG
jgi:glycogen debranching enzyme